MYNNTRAPKTFWGSSQVRPLSVAKRVNSLLLLVVSWRDEVSKLLPSLLYFSNRGVPIVEDILWSIGVCLLVESFGALQLLNPLSGAEGEEVVVIFFTELLIKIFLEELF